ncbi:MAG: GDSL-type esterase/lipase family protein [Guyparkeria sp.]|uniref:DUF459 domain-containing protein n=1 Tax=Guyparkeria sp. TaxID=2035736 RepID=UPI003978B2EF
MSDLRICFVGDSFVNGTGDETALGWAGRLCREAHARGIPVTYYNLGVRRDTSRDILRRVEAECSPRLPPGCDGRVVLSCGVNDTQQEHGKTRVPRDESVANFRKIVESVTRHRCLVVGPPPVGDEEHNRRIQGLSEAFGDLASALGTPYVDLFTPLVAAADYRRTLRDGDGAHPGAAGYERMARIVSSSPAWWF